MNFNHSIVKRLMYSAKNKVMLFIVIFSCTSLYAQDKIFTLTKVKDIINCNVYSFADGYVYYHNMGDTTLAKNPYSMVSEVVFADGESRRIRNNVVVVDEKIVKMYRLFT